MFWTTMLKRREKSGMVTLFTHLLFPPSCPAVRKCRRCNVFFNMNWNRQSYSDPHGKEEVLGLLPQSQHMDSVDDSSNMSFIDIPNTLQKELLV